MACAFIPLAGAGPTDTIVVTLTPGGSVDITVVNSTGGTEWHPTASVPSGTQTTAGFNLSNVGDIPCDVTIEGENTNGGWDLNTVAVGHDAFRMAYNITTANYFDETPEAFASDLPVSEEAQYWVIFSLTVEMPSSTSTNAAQTTTITFTGTAA